MATAKLRKLSGSTDGRDIKVVATGDPGTTIHTAVAGTTAGTFDQIWLYAVNSDSVARLLTIEFGGNSNPDDYVQVSIPSQSGMQLILPGFILQNGMVVKAFAAAANVVTVGGYVITTTD